MRNFLLYKNWLKVPVKRTIKIIEMPDSTSLFFNISHMFIQHFVILTETEGMRTKWEKSQKGFLSHADFTDCADFFPI